MFEQTFKNIDDILYKDSGRRLGKTNPLNDNDMKEFVELQKTKPETEKILMFRISIIDEETFDLSVKNLYIPVQAPLIDYKEILEEMKKLDTETSELFKSLGELL